MLSAGWPNQKGQHFVMQRNLHALASLQTSGKERYVFFSFPHIGIDSRGAVGNISRPGRPGMSCACGAVIKSLADFKKDGLSCSCKEPGGAGVRGGKEGVAWGRERWVTSRAQFP